jgi:hypothetical protein
MVLMATSIESIVNFNKIKNFNFKCVYILNFFNYSLT